jgi:hypothetical protein
MARFTYKIIVTNNSKQVDYIGSYATAASANRVFHRMVSESKKVKFPTLHINMGRHIQSSNYELVIIKRREEGESKTTSLRNRYGQFVEHETDDDGWVVYDKSEYFVEDTFWVYGFHPIIQRKDFQFIFDNLVKPKANAKRNIINVILFRNKLLLDCGDTMDLVICKNHSDGVRLYNAIEQESVKQKLKHILFSGDWNYHSERRKDAIEKIKRLTHWDEMKIKRYNTKP